MYLFLRSIPGNIIRVFSGKKLGWHFLAIIITFACAGSGLDWIYFGWTRGELIQAILFPSIILGALLPIVVPLALLFSGTANSHPRTRWTGWAVGQAALVGWLVSSAYKAFSGRIGPPQVPGSPDVSDVFHFGFWRGGIFWGWPSSHTTVAFAMAFALIYLFPHNKVVRYASLLYAFYIGIGVSVSIHWFSDFMAGAIIGSVIGVVVGKYFHRKQPAFHHQKK